jgi:hypothetical protein
LRRAVVPAVLVAILAMTPAVTAQTQTEVGVPGRGRGWFSTTLQYGTIHERTAPSIAGGGLEEFGKITLRSVLLELDYGLSDRLAVNVLLPYRSNRYEGDFPHDPRLLENDHGQRFLDDGHYHSEWADWGVGLRYQALLEPLVITPFVSFYAPTHEYPYYTETQAGSLQWRLDLGLNAGDRFGRSNVYWEAGYAYSYMEATKPEGFPERRVNHGTLHVELGWLATPELTARTVVTYLHTYNGLTFTDDFNPPFTDDLFYYHDRLFKWGGTFASVGVDYRINDIWSVSADFGRTVQLDWGNKIDHAYSLALTCIF